MIDVLFNDVNLRVNSVFTRSLCNLSLDSMPKYTVTNNVKLNNLTCYYIDSVKSDCIISYL